MKLFLVEAYEIDIEKWISFLIYAKSYKEARREIQRHCQLNNLFASSFHSHEITFQEDEIRRIDYLLH